MFPKPSAISNKPLAQEVLIVLRLLGGCYATWRGAMAAYAVLKIKSKDN
jgi:hypothetical protein